ncbi:MAG: sigma-54-dependent transcriptional regulator [Terracidiphilus sp.]
MPNRELLRSNEFQSNYLHLDADIPVQWKSISTSVGNQCPGFAHLNGNSFAAREVFSPRKVCIHEGMRSLKRPSLASSRFGTCIAKARVNLLKKTMAVTTQDTQRPIKTTGHIDAQFRLAVSRLAECDYPVLIVGEHGVGKRFTAAQIHLRSHRSRSTYQELSCRELDAQTMLSALSTKSTIYLTEVADLDLSLQELLIRSYFLSGQVQSCRLLFGSSRELSEEVKSLRLREDFYCFISGVTLRIPPLRHRKSEILGIADTFLAQYSKQFDRPRPVLCAEIIRFLMDHTWPENLAELQTAIKTLVAIGDQSVSLVALKAATPTVRWNGHRRSRSLKEATRSASIQIERQMITEVLGSTGGNRKRAADELGISYKALLYKIKQFGVEDETASKELGVAV